MSNYHNACLKKINTNTYIPQNFCELEKMTTDSNSAGNFHARIRKAYSNYFTLADSMTEARYGIRYYRSKKLLYSSAQMREEARVSEENGLLISYYYLMYYSLLQAMQSCLILSTDFDDEKVLDLSHAKIKTYFKEHFCDMQCCPMDIEIIDLFDRLRALREYFSYAMPFNVCEEAVISKEAIDHYLKSCYQLNNLLLCILNTVRCSVSCMYSDHTELKKYLNSSCNRLSEKEFPDDADYFFFKEYKRYGSIDILPITLAFDYDFDEYGTYDSSYYEKSKIDRNKSSSIISKALSMIYESLVYH